MSSTAPQTGATYETPAGQRYTIARIARLDGEQAAWIDWCGMAGRSAKGHRYLVSELPTGTLVSA